MGDFVTPDSWQRIRVQTQRRKRGESGSYEITVIRPDGRERFVTLTSTPQYDRGGQAIGAFGVLHDDTEHRRDEEARRRSEQRYATIAENLPRGAVYVIDRDLHYVYAAGQQLIKVGLTREMLKGKSVYDVLSMKNAAMVAVQLRRVLNGETVTFEGDFSGDRFILNAVPLPAPDGRINEVLVLAMNINERRQMEDALLKARDELDQRVRDRTEDLAKTNEELDKVNKLKTYLINMMMHDFGSPLWVVKGYSEMLRDGEFGLLNVQQQESIDEVIKSVQTLENLRADLLELSRLEKGSIVLEKTACDLREIVAGCVDEFGLLARNKRQEIASSVPSLPVECDPKRMRQAVANYLSNAIRYTPQGGRVDVTAWLDNGYVHVSVKDNGRGIPRDDVDRVFSEFFRGSGGAEKSSGFGLAVVKRVVEAHGGTVSCTSEPGLGSDFRFSIPVST